MISKTLFFSIVLNQKSIFDQTCKGHSLFNFSCESIDPVSLCHRVHRFSFWK